MRLQAEAAALKNSQKTHIYKYSTRDVAIAKFCAKICTKS